MADFTMTTSGHVFVPQLTGRGNFENFPGMPWSDQQGYCTPSERRFMLQPNRRVEFYAPVPTPVIVNGARLRANFAAVTMWIQLGLLMDRFSVWDRTALIFNRNLFSSPVQGDFRSQWINGRNAFVLEEDRQVQGHLVIAVWILSGDSGGEIRFTGAGIRFHD